MSRILHLCLVTATVGAGVLLSATPAVAADNPTVTYAGSAYGSAIRLGTLVRSGHTSAVSICTSSGDTSKTNNTAAVNVPNVGRIGAVVTKVRTVSSPAESIADSSTAATNLFAGVIRVRAIAAHATVTQTSNGFATAGYSTVAGLIINNHPIAIHPAPNTVIALPGIGRVVLNRQSTSTSYGLTAFTVTAITVLVDAGNTHSLPVGSIALSSATAAIHKPTYSRASGDAYGTSVQVGSVVKSGQTAFVSIGCGGNDGEIARNNVETSTVPGVLSTGTLTTTATSTDSPSATSAKTTAHVEGLSLFGGLVRVSAIDTRASETRQDGVNSYGATGTSFLKLVIGGRTINGTPPRNTSYSIAGLGTVYVNVVKVTGPTVHAEGLRIVLGSDQGGLPAGAVIDVAVAEVTVVG